MREKINPTAEIITIQNLRKGDKIVINNDYEEEARDIARLYLTKVASAFTLEKNLESLTNSLLQTHWEVYGIEENPGEAKFNYVNLINNNLGTPFYGTVIKKIPVAWFNKK